MKTTGRKTVFAFAVYLAFFLLAGLLQAVDASLPEFWHALFSLAAHVILLSLVISWGVSLVHRMVRRDLLGYLLSVASLILFFLAVRMVKYGLTEETDILSRYMWYSYYVAQCLIPPTILLLSLSLERKNGRPLGRGWYAVYLPALVLLCLLYTNDLHGWAFALRFEDGGLSYTHGPVFYLAMVWEIGVTALSLGVLTVRCSISACRKKGWIPVCTLAVCAVFTLLCFVFDPPAFKQPELLCLTCIAVLESCIAIGLIPSNAGYGGFIDRSVCPVIITDTDLRAAYRSERAPSVSREMLALAVKTPVMLDRNTRFCAEHIHGGYVFRTEDLSAVNRTNERLAETRERLSEKNDLIAAENDLREQQVRVAEQNRLFGRMAETVRAGHDRLMRILSSEEIASDRAHLTAGLRRACVTAAYLKRRGNLVMLAEKHPTVHTGELVLALRESLDYLSLCGADCSLVSEGEGGIGGAEAGLLYDYFDACIEGAEVCPAACIVRLTVGAREVSLRVESDAPETDPAAALSPSALAEIGARHGRMEKRVCDGACYYGLSFPVGGAS